MHGVRRALAGLVATIAVVSLAACSGSSSTTSAAGASTGAQATEVRLGYFPNVTHATAIVADKEGRYTKALGSTSPR